MANVIRALAIAAMLCETEIALIAIFREFHTAALVAIGLVAVCVYAVKHPERAARALRTGAAK